MTGLLVLMSCSTLLGISLKENAQKEADRFRKSLASGFVMSADIRNEMYHKFVENEKGGGGYIYDGPRITDEMIEKICSVDGVKEYDTSLEQLVWTDLEIKQGAWTSEQADDPETIEENRKMGYFCMSEEELMVWRKELCLFSCRNGDLQKNFRTGALTITKGRNIQQGDSFKAVISDWMAEKNRLSIGDTVTVELKEGLYQYSEEPMKTWGKPVRLEIVGLFHANFSQPASEHTYESDYAENVIYTDMDVYDRLRDEMVRVGFTEDEERKYDKAEFLVEDPGRLDSIMQQIEHWDELDLENIKLTVDSSAYQASVKPYHQIRVFASALLAVGIGGMGIILYLLVRLWSQSRRQEIGILRSLGKTKAEILGQMLAECLLVSAAALALTFCLSGPMVEHCANAVEQAVSPKKDTEAYRVVLSRSMPPEYVKNSADEVVLGHEASGRAIGFTVLFVCGISCVSVLLSFFGLGSTDAV